MAKNNQRKKATAEVTPRAAKRPLYDAKPYPTKVPAIGPLPSPNESAPSWRIAKLELVNPPQCGEGWGSVGDELLHEIRTKLAHFEAKTWNEILVKEKHWNHTVPVSKLRGSARERLRAMKLDDIEEVVSLRLTGPQRVWGYRIASVFHVLWWDPDHQVYSG